ncbi:hypothetical protein PVL29_018672 [Vitis rotundifolia]|uniref:Uncharacterized protein n=1 Tax=Vitis rotundifolia TaxID=103349 RepID=A0AA39DHY2_VITRO|nr:hypothetical protein PVL29_018672 [Vitis rotundifolia]
MSSGVLCVAQRIVSSMEQKEEGCQNDDHVSLAKDYIIQEDSTLYLVLRLRGSVKKCKKKAKPAILQSYKVDDSGKIKRLRNERPNSECVNACNLGEVESQN